MTVGHSFVADLGPAAGGRLEDDVVGPEVYHGATQHLPGGNGDDGVAGVPNVEFFHNSLLSNNR